VTRPRDSNESPAWGDLYERLAHLLTGRPPFPPIGDETSWQALLDMADQEGVTPLLSQALKALPAVPVPEPVRETLAGAYRDAVYASLLRDSTRSRVCRRLDQQMIPVILLKGAALALLYYDDPATRPMRDLDLLVPEERVEEAARCLEEEGFRSRYRAPPRRRDYHQVYIHTGNGAVVELHWPRQLIGQASPDTIARIWREALPLRSNEPALSLRLGDMIPLLCAHMTVHHRYARVLWLYDLHRVLLATDEAEAAHARDAAERWRLAPCTALSLLRVHRLFDTPLPGTLHPWAETVAHRTGLQARVAALALMPGSRKRPAAHLITLVRKGDWSLIRTLFPTPESARRTLDIDEGEWGLPDYVSLVARRLRNSPTHLRDLWNLWRSTRRPSPPKETRRPRRSVHQTEEGACPK
jgi:hypothetical protein